MKSMFKTFTTSSFIILCLIASSNLFASNLDKEKHVEQFSIKLLESSQEFYFTHKNKKLFKVQSEGGYPWVSHIKTPNPNYYLVVYSRGSAGTSEMVEFYDAAVFSYDHQFIDSLPFSIKGDRSAETLKVNYEDDAIIVYEGERLLKIVDID